MADPWPDGKVMGPWAAISHLSGPHMAGSGCKRCRAARAAVRAVLPCQHQKHDDVCLSCEVRALVASGRA